MRIGIMGGTLDPVHNGHLQIALCAKKALELDRVMLLPAGDPPHKANPTLKQDRLNMARIAAEQNDDFFVCDAEICRSGTTYTVDTLAQLCAEFPSDEWFYIIGADTLAVLESWRDLKGVAKRCTFVVAGRAEDAPDLRHAEALREAYGCKFHFLPIGGPAISSTEIRDRACRGEDVGAFVPQGVADYIRNKGLYLCNRSKDALLEELRRTLKPSRYRHTLGVAETATRLAERCGVNPAKAEIAALLHDCAKYLTEAELRTMLAKYPNFTDADELAAPSVLHAPAGCILAREKFGVEDREILSAIRKHTIGDAHMSALDALIYTADFIEPGRTPFCGLDEARALAETDIFAAARKCALLTNAYLRTQGQTPHPKSLIMIKNIESQEA